MESAQARPRSQVASSTPTCLPEQLPGGGIKNFPGHHEVNGRVADRQAPEVQDRGQRPVTHQQVLGGQVAVVPARRRTVCRSGQLHGFGPDPLGCVEVEIEVLQGPATLDVLSRRLVHRRERLSSVRLQVRVVDRPHGYLRLPQGVQDRGQAPSPGLRVVGRRMCPDRPPPGVHHRSSGPPTSAPGSRGRARTRQPRQARRRTAVAPAPAAMWPPSRWSPTLRAGAAAAPGALRRDGTTRSSSRSMPAGESARRRTQASPGPPGARTSSASIGISSGWRARATPGLNPTARSHRNRLPDARDCRAVGGSAHGQSAASSARIERGSPATTRS